MILMTSKEDKEMLRMNLEILIFLILNSRMIFHSIIIIIIKIKDFKGNNSSRICNRISMIYLMIMTIKIIKIRIIRTIRIISGSIISKIICWILKILPKKTNTPRINKIKCNSNNNRIRIRIRINSFSKISINRSKISTNHSKILTKLSKISTNNLKISINNNSRIK